MLFKKLFIGFIALFVLFNLSFSQERPELKFRYVKVEKGDTFWKLFGDKWEFVAQMNNINPENLKIGTRLIVPSDWDLVEERFDQQLILVEIRKRTLKFFENGKLKLEFSVRVGKKDTPTPIGTGIIYIKRERPVFRYIKGPKKGEIIYYSQLEDGRVIKIPTKDMRALGIFICGISKCSIHSTTEENTIGRAVSSGCIGMRIKDMLLLYSYVKTGAKIIIKS